MSTMTAADLLGKAADIIDERGWTRWDFENTDGCLCAVGALRVAAFGTVNLGFVTPSLIEDRDAAYPTAIRKLRKEVDAMAVGGIPGWNDARERTAAEVTATLRKLAATL